MRKRTTRAAGVLVGALVLAGCGGGGPSFAVTALGPEGGPTGGTASMLAAGGDVLVVEGAGFRDGAQVLFDDVAAAAVVFVDDTELRATTPAMPEGWASVAVRNPSGDQAVRDDAVFFGVQPVVAAVAPLDPDAVLGVDGGPTLVVTGSAFRDGARVLVDANESPAVTVVDPTTLHFELPPRVTEADVSVHVLNPGGFEGVLPGAFFQTQAQSLAPQPPAISEAQVRHLMQRAGFGVTPGELSGRFGGDLPTIVARLLRIADDAATLRVEADAWALFGDAPPPSGQLSSRANQEWWIHLMHHNPNPLQERLAWFLHDHFATSQTQFGGDRRWWMYEQIQLFRRFGMSRADGGLEYDWEALLVEVCKDRAMLDWLDGVRSRKGAPNENFARELWELFMLGEGNGYTQADIVEAARAFTGFRTRNVPDTDYDDVWYDPTRHDEEAKTVLGVTGFFGYDDIAPFHAADPALRTDPRDSDGGIVALTLRERPVEASRFVCRKLVVYFLDEDPADAMVDDLAALLRASDWNLRPVLERLLGSKAMFSRETRKDRIRMPVEFVLPFLRNTGAEYAANRARNTLNLLEQGPMQPPDVSGWPRGSAWMGGQAMIERINFLRDVVEQLDDVPTQIEPLIPPLGSRSPAALVDHLARVLDVELTPVARAGFEAYCSTTLDGDTEVARPFDPADDRMLREKVRGLLYLIGQYHDQHRD